MNISLKNEIIWLSPECTGGKFFAKLLENYDFFVYDRKNKLNQRLITLSEFSWTSNIPEEFKNFKKIMTVRNPYSRVYACYENFYNKNLISRDLGKVKKRFNSFLDKAFIHSDFHVVLDKNLSQDSYFSKWDLSKFLPDETIRYENAKNDFLNLELIKKNGLKFDENKFIEIDTDSFDQIDFRTLYEPTNAWKVFQYFKNYFFRLNYDPFSFTKEVLTDTDKVNFIHNRF